MANYVHKPGTGSLLQNNKKTTSSHPDLRGEIVMDRDMKAGESIGIAGWKSENAFGGLIKIRLDKPRDGTEQWPKKVGSLDDSEVPF
jgi:hypothetical protein